MRDESRRFDEALAAARREARGTPGPQGGRASGAAAHRWPERSPRDAVWLDLLHRSPPPALALAHASRPSTEAVATAPAAAALRAAVRALPATIEAARLHDGAQLALTLGGALGVDLRGGAAGVEVTLRPAAALGQAVAAELPALVAALRARGIRVARAEVAPSARRPPGSPGRQPR